MKTYTAKEVGELDRPILELQFMRVQNLCAAKERRLVTIRQRAVLIGQHVKRLADIVI